VTLVSFQLSSVKQRTSLQVTQFSAVCYGKLTMKYVAAFAVLRPQIMNTWPWNVTPRNMIFVDVLAEPTAYIFRVERNVQCRRWIQ
jgi:hypothetical protein